MEHNIEEEFGLKSDELELIADLLDCRDDAIDEKKQSNGLWWEGYFQGKKRGYEHAISKVRDYLKKKKESE